MHGDFLQSPMPYIYFTSTRTPSIFTSYNTRVNKKFSHFDPHFHASQWGFAIQQGSGSALGRVSGRDSRESMADQYSSEDNQSSGTPGPPSPVSLAGDSRESMVNQYSPEDIQAIETPVRPRPCLWQGTAENRWWTDILSRITRPSRPRSDLGRVSGRGQPRIDGGRVFFRG